MHHHPLLVINEPLSHQIGGKLFLSFMMKLPTCTTLIVIKFIFLQVQLCSHLKLSPILLYFGHLFMYNLKSYLNYLFVTSFPAFSLSCFFYFTIVIYIYLLIYLFNYFLYSGSTACIRFPAK